MSTPTPKCAVCKVPAVQLCAGCKNVYYCTRDHQKKHWKEGHKNNCAPYKLVPSPEGNYLVATRDLKQNEIILKESPIITAPPSTCYIQCLSCFKRIKKTPEDVYRCANCNWFLCDKKCQDSAIHRDECNLMVANNYKADFKYSEKEKTDMYNIISPLRTILLKQNSKHKYDTLINLLKRPEQLSEYIKKSSTAIKASIIPFLQEILKITLTEIEIIEAIALFDLHAFEITKEDTLARAVYPTASLLKHDCVANTKYSIQGENFQLILITTVPIAKGEAITTSYSEILWGTLARRQHIRDTKYFDCVCQRCSDKTEAGTLLGAIFCSKCKVSNEEASPKILSTDPLNSTAIWKCEKCDHTIRGRQMVWGNDAIKSEMNRFGKNPLLLEQFLVKYKETLHDTNYHALVAKYALCQVYGNIKEYQLSGKYLTIKTKIINCVFIYTKIIFNP